MYEHAPEHCFAVECLSCLAFSRNESIIRLERALLELETSPEGCDGGWVELSLTADALDVRNVLDLLRN